MTPGPGVGSLAAAALAAVVTAVALPAPGAGQQGEGAAARRDGAPRTGAPARLAVELSGPAGEGIQGASVLARLGSGSGAGAPGATPGPLRLAETAPGRYAADAPSAGRYRLHVVARGYRDWSREVVLSPGEEVRVAVRLAPEPVPLDALVARARRDPDHVPPGRSVDRTRFGERGAAAGTLGEWLDGLPGVDVRRRGAGGRQVVSVRGSRPEGVLVLVDGVPINDPLTGAADLSGIPTATLESATLVRGTFPDAGPGALGGVLLLRSRASDGTAVTFGMEAASFGRIAADVHASGAGAAGSLSVTGRYEESRNDYGFRNRVHPERPLERRRNADARSWHGAAAATAAALPLTLRARMDRLERGAPGRMGTRLFDAARWEDTGWQLALEAGRGTRLEAGAAARIRSLRYRDPRIGDASRHGATDLRLRARARFGASARWEAAARLGVERARGDRLAGDPDRGSGGLSLSRRIGGPSLALRPVLALDWGGDAIAWSPSLSLAAHPADGWRLWARAGRAFRLPTFSDLYFASAHGVRPNPDLRPERVRFDGELGAAWTSADGRLRLRGAAFTRITGSPIVWLPSSLAVWSPRNLGRLAARGLEVDLALEPGSGWRIEASGTAERSRLASGIHAQPLPYLPAVRGRVGLERGGRRGSVRAALRAVGTRTTSLAGTHRLPGFGLLDLSGRTAFAAGGVPLELRVGVRNVLDARYELVELFPEPGRSLEARVTVGPVPDE